MIGLTPFLLSNGLMLIAIIGLWVLWFRNAKRQRYLQHMLAETSRQLRAASGHLEEAMQAIRELKRVEESSQAGVVSRRSVPLQEMHPSTGNNATVTQVLRMQREGHDVEEIASKLKTPPAQVRLLLKLHAAGNSAS